MTGVNSSLCNVQRSSNKRHISQYNEAGKFNVYPLWIWLNSQTYLTLTEETPVSLFQLINNGGEYACVKDLHVANGYPIPLSLSLSLPLSRLRFASLLGFVYIWETDWPALSRLSIHDQQVSMELQTISPAIVTSKWSVTICYKSTVTCCIEFSHCFNNYTHRMHNKCQLILIYCSNAVHLFHSIFLHEYPTANLRIFPRNQLYVFYKHSNVTFPILDNYSCQ